MKKFLHIKIAVILMLIAMVGLFSACDFVAKKSTDDGSDGSSKTETNYYTETGLISSVKDPSAISFSDLHTDKYDEINEVVAATNVDRAVVTLYCEYGNYKSIGSGVIVNVDDGSDSAIKNKTFYIITCHHIVDELPDYLNNKITVYIPDNNGNNYDDAGYNNNFSFSGSLTRLKPTSGTRAVELVGGDKTSDIAVLKIYVSNDIIAANIVKANVMSEENSLGLGERVFAIGNCLGTHAGWLSSGTISDLKNTFTLKEVGEMTLLGIDVSIFPGNSGGGLFNMYGELVGITNSGDVIEVVDAYGEVESVTQRLNYAIAHYISDGNGFINIARQLIESCSTYNYGYVSARKEKMKFTAVQNGNGFGSYVYVATIETDGTAYKAGLRKNDVITEVSLNGKDVQTVSSLSVLNYAIESSKGGDILTMTVSRNNSTFTVSVTMRQYLFCDTGVYTGIIAE